MKMLVMDVPFEVMRTTMGDIGGGEGFVYELDRGTHWEYYVAMEPPIVWRSTKQKLGGEDDAMFRATLPKQRIVRVRGITWGKHVTVTSMLSETRDEPDTFEDDIAPELPLPVEDEDEPESEVEPEE